MVLIQKILPQKKGEIGYDGNKKVKGSKISALTDKNGLPMSIFISPANIHDSKLYLQTIDNFRIKLPVGAPINRPKMIIADSAYDTKEIRRYNRSRGISTNIAINKRNSKRKKRGRPINFNKIIYKKRNAIERFFSWIESYKKISPRHERSERSYLGLVTLACISMLWRVLG